MFAKGFQRLLQSEDASGVREGKVRVSSIVIPLVQSTEVNLGCVQAELTPELRNGAKSATGRT